MPVIYVILVGYFQISFVPGVLDEVIPPSEEEVTVKTVRSVKLTSTKVFFFPWKNRQSFLRPPVVH